MSIFTELRNTVYLRRIARSLEKLVALREQELAPAPARKRAKLVHMDVVDDTALRARWERQVNGEEPEVDG